MTAELSHVPRSVEAQSTFRLVDTRELVPRTEALEHTAVIYRDFANMPHISDYQIELSRIVRQDLRIIRNPRGIIFEKNLADSLKYHELITRGLEQQAAYLSLRGLISVNMVIPEATADGTLLAHIQEPFDGIKVLNPYFQEFTEKLEKQRHADEVRYA